MLLISDSLGSYGLLALLIPVVCGIGWQQLAETPWGRRWLDQLKLKLPLVGGVFHETSVSRFCRVLGTLLGNGVPILRSLDISSHSAGNVLLQEAIRESAQNISSGNLLSQTIGGQRTDPRSGHGNDPCGRRIEHSRHGAGKNCRSHGSKSGTPPGIGGAVDRTIDVVVDRGSG